MPMTPEQAVEALRQRGAPLTAENLNRMMAASYGMDAQPPTGTVVEGPNIDTSIADDDAQRDSQPPINPGIPPQPPSISGSVSDVTVTGPGAPKGFSQPVTGVPGPTGLGFSFDSGSNAPSPNQAVDNISPSDPADTGSMPAAPVGAVESKPLPMPGSPADVNRGGSYELGNAESMPSPVEALLGAGGELGDRLFNEGMTIPRGAAMSPHMPSAPALLQQFMQLLQRGGYRAPQQ